MDKKHKRNFWTVVFVLFLAAATVFFAMIKPLGQKTKQPLDAQKDSIEVVE